MEAHKNPVVTLETTQVAHTCPVLAHCLCCYEEDQEAEEQDPEELPYSLNVAGEASLAWNRY